VVIRAQAAEPPVELLFHAVGIVEEAPSHASRWRSSERAGTRANTVSTLVPLHDTAVWVTRPLPVSGAA